MFRAILERTAPFFMPQLVAVLSIISLPSTTAYAANDKAAEKLLRDNDCTKCHSVTREKEGPAYRKVAEKYKGKSDAGQKLFIHLTSEPTVKVDGKDEKHKKIQAPSDAEIKNLIEWILSR